MGKPQWLEGHWKSIKIYNYNSLVFGGCIVILT